MRKSYKQSSAFLAMGNRGQIAIFVIVAIVIVGFFLAFFLYPRLNITGSIENDPIGFMQECIEPEVTETLSVVMSQGGYYEPTNFLLHEDTEVQYLCYTDAYYEPCSIQQPLLITHVSQEIQRRVQPVARQCFDTLKQAYESQGYTVQGTASTVNVSLTPGAIRVDFAAPLSVTKESTQTFRRFGASVRSEAYDMLTTATSILMYESTMGDSETTLYIQFYPNLQIEKVKRDADTIYTIRNVETQEEFTFATRSLVWPQGYGTEVSAA